MIGGGGHDPLIPKHISLRKYFGLLGVMYRLLGVRTHQDLPKPRLRSTEEVC
jgi:hypothetical protein